MKESLEAEFNSQPSTLKHGRRRTQDHAASPSTEANNDPAPTEHPIDNGDQNRKAENRYLASKPFRAKKGDRFS